MDGVYIKAGLEREKAAVLLVLVALADEGKMVVTVALG